MSDHEKAVGSLKDLLQQFRVAKHADMGDCIVIPEDSFDPDWDDVLTQVTEVHSVGGYVFVKLPVDMVPKKKRQECLILPLLVLSKKAWYVRSVRLHLTDYAKIRDRVGCPCPSPPCEICPYLDRCGGCMVHPSRRDH